MKFKKGDKVLIREDLVVDTIPEKYEVCVHPSMVSLAGKIATITHVYEEGERYSIDLDNWSWSEDLFKEVGFKLKLSDVINLINDGDTFYGVNDRSRRISRKGDSLIMDGIDNTFNLNEEFERFETLTFQEVINKDNIGCEFMILENERVFELDEYLELFEDCNNITDIYTLGEIVNFKYVKLN